MTLKPLENSGNKKGDVKKSIGWKNKEQLYILLHEQDTKKRKKAFVEFADGMKQSGIHELERCADTYYHWLTGILASLEYPYSNGFTEGCNNKIKVLKRVAYGYRNFDVFRNKILFAF